MVSDFAVAQCGQVMTDSRIMVLPQACSRYRRLQSDINPSSMVQASAVEAEGNQRETQDQRRDQHIVGLCEPSSEPDRAKRDDEQRRHATYRRKDGADCTGRDEGAIMHGQFNSSARRDTPPPSWRG